MRLATYNLESLDLPPKAKISLDERAEVLRPVLERLDADILCPAGGQRAACRWEEGTGARSPRPVAGWYRYADYARAATTGPRGGVLDVHNLVTLSRFPFARIARCCTARAPAAAPALRRCPARRRASRALRPPCSSPKSRLRRRQAHRRQPASPAPLAANVPGQKIEPWSGKRRRLGRRLLSVGDPPGRSGARTEIAARAAVRQRSPQSDRGGRRLQRGSRDAAAARDRCGGGHRQRGASPRDRSCCSTARFPRICAGACCTMAGRRCSITSSQAERCTVRSARSRSTTKRWVTNSWATARGYARRRPITPLWLRSSRPGSFRVDALAFWHRRHSVERPRPSSCLLLPGPELGRPAHRVADHVRRPHVPLPNSTSLLIARPRSSCRIRTSNRPAKSRPA